MRIAETPFALMLAGALLLAACDDGADGEAGAAAAPPPPTVTVAHPLAQKLVEWTEFTGRFEAVQRVEVRARVSGYLNSIDFRDGEMVERGEVLFVIDPRPFEVAVRARQGRPRQRRGAGQARRHRVPAGRRPRHQPGLLARELRPAAPGEGGRPGQPDGGPGGDGQGPARPRLHPGQRADRRPRLRPPRRHRQPRDRRRRCLTTIVALDPIYFVFDMSEGDFLAYQRAVAARRAALDPRPRDGGRGSARRRGRLGRRGHDELRRQPDRPGLRHDPRARRCAQPRAPASRPASSAASASRARPSTRRSSIPDSAIVTDQSNSS